jgi:hypothetical protein
MKTGMELIKQIAECSSKIAQLQGSPKAAVLRQRREELRQELETLPELSFT